MSLYTKGKYFKQFTPKELFTEYIFNLMKQGKEIMMFLDNNQILIDDEIEEWYMIHNLLDETERVLYHNIGNQAYRVHYIKHPMNVYVPFDLLEKSYEDFIKQCEEDVNYTTK